jgi:sugar/nucleoside kinase (ribokinase family)
MAAASNLFGMENWTMIPFMSDIWEGLITEVFPLMPQTEIRPLAFFDLADPEKRTREDVSRAMGLITRFQEKFDAVLGLNEKELYQIASVLGLGDFTELSQQDMSQLAEKVRDKMGIFCLVAHPVKFACAAVKGGNGYVDGPFCAKPKLTTGAGDNFNAGFTLGLALGLCFTDALALGVCSSGFYVRNARSATYGELITFAEAWAAGQV